MKEKLISKHIRLSADVLNQLNKEADFYGYKLNQWIRYILTNRAFDLSIKTTSERQLARKMVKILKYTPQEKRPPLRNIGEIDDFIDRLKKDLD